MRACESFSLGTESPRSPHQLRGSPEGWAPQQMAQAPRDTDLRKTGHVSETEVVQVWLTLRCPLLRSAQLYVQSSHV